MAYLIDTNVVSELRRRKPHGAVLEWVSALDDTDMFLSAVTVAEIQSGIELTRDQDIEKAQEIEQWLDQVSQAYNVLDMTAAAFRVWAKLMHKSPDHLIEDTMIAATALCNNLVVATRNVKDFEGLGVTTFNPFKQ